MFSLVSLCFLINTIILVFGSGVNRKHVVIQQHTANSATCTVSSLIEGMRAEIRNLDREQAELSSREDNLQKAINKVKIECGREVEGILQQQQSLMKTAGKNLQVLKQQALLIQKEEEELERLEGEFMSYSVLADLWKLKHDVVLGDLQLMSGRRQNGTSERCRNITVQVDAEEVHRSQARSAYWTKVMIMRKRHVSTESIQFKVQEMELNRRADLKKRMLRMLDETQEALHKEQEECAKTRAKETEMLETIKTMLITTEGSKTLLHSDLNLAQSMSKELRQKTQSVKHMITNLRQAVIEMKKDLARYRDDMRCYIKVERYS